MTFNKTIARLLPLTWMLAVLACFTACSGSDEAVTETPVTPSNNSKNVAVTFNTYVQSGNTQTRATYPTISSMGEIDINRLKTMGFGVFAQHTSNTAWTSYDQATPFNFMWNQQVAWDGTSAWTYSPVKYWPNDNTPADKQSPAATGSQDRSYLSFFAYAPYAPVATPASGFDVKDVDENSDGKPDHDGIVAVSLNNTNANASYLYYRTSNEIPFSPEKSVDLLWATAQDLYKMKSSGEGYVDGKVQLTFKHALSKVGIYVKALIDRTQNNTSPAYSTELDPNTRIFIESATLTMPDFYSEGKLFFTPDNATPTVPRWNFDGLSDKKKEGLSLDNIADNAVPDVRYALRYADPNVPQNRNWDGQDPITDLYDYEQAKEDFDAMETGLTSAEQQLAADQSEFMFPPSGISGTLTVNLVYDVITYDRNLVLNNPKYYSVVQNNITAELSSLFTWEPNKKYKILLEPGLTSAKFTLAEITEWGEVIVISSVVKEWDIVTKEVDVE